jgi:DNA-binding beta-propeller fold protein YncE
MWKAVVLPVAVAVTLSLAPSGSVAQSAPRLIVANQTDHTISIVDTATNRQLATVDEKAITGHEVAVSPDGRTAYVPIYSNVGVGKAGTDGRLLLAIDLATRKITGKLDFGHGVRPHCILYNAHDGLLYITTELEQSITLVDPHTLKIVGSIPTTQAQSHMLALSHDGRFGYTANVGPGTVSVLDIKARKALAVIPISTDTQRILVSNDDSMVFTADQTRPQLAVIDTKSRAIKTWIALPAIGYGTAETPDSRWLLVAMRPLNQVAVVDLQTMRVARTMDVPKTPTEIIITPDGKLAYASCGQNVAVLDLARWTLSATIEAGQGADGLALAQ